MKKVLVFGIFDGIHPGHISFLRQAKKCGDFLVVAVGRASSCRKIKCKTPKYSLRKRLTALKTAHLNGELLVEKAVPGDIKQGTYKVILREKPDVICLGYDQMELAENLKAWLRQESFSLTIKFLKPYKPDQYHTRIMRDNP